ncbi:carboxy terminal-processing peptidase [Verrucomicrobiota bacterium]
MRRNLRVLCLFLMFWALQSIAPAGQAALAPEPLHNEIAKRLANVFPKEHLTRMPLDDTISSRTWTNYLSSLDYDRIYFMASDIAIFEKEKLLLDDQLKLGDVNFAYNVFEIFKERVKNRCEYVNRLLENEFDFEKDESWKWDRKNKSWPANEKEMDETWRKIVKNEYVRQIVSRELEEKNSSQESGVRSQESQPQADPPTAGGDGIEEQSVTNNIIPETPEEYILNRYKQFNTIISDNDSEWVLEKYLSAFAQAFDPHSDYMSPSTVENFNIQMRLSLVGIGALLRPEDGTAKIVRLIPGGPAELGGKLKPNDKIIAVAQGNEPPVDIRHWPLDKAVKIIRGKKKTWVVLTVIPASDPTGSTTKQISILRDEVKLESQAAKSKIEKVTGDDGVTRKLGIVTIPAFYADISMNSKRSCTDDVNKILADLNKENVDGVLVDLRNNGGGFLPEARDMTGLFLKTGPVVQVKSKYGRDQLVDNDRTVAYNGPLIVLVNRLSASASEIMTGALQDYGRAVIVGDSQTHGKGTVQSILKLGWEKKFGSAKITSAMYYRISGDSTQKKGVLPDIIIPSVFDQKEYSESSLPNPMGWDRIDELKYAPVISKTNITELISTLGGKSEKRRAADSRFEANAKLRDRFKAVGERKEITLNITKRKKLAKADKELYELRREIPGFEENPNNDENINNDLILYESLKILADLVTLRKNIRQLEPEPSKPPSAIEAFFEWLGDSL